jgi:hypothetical protein
MLEQQRIREWCYIEDEEKERFGDLRTTKPRKGVFLFFSDEDPPLLGRAGFHDLLWKRRFPFRLRRRCNL